MQCKGQGYMILIYRYQLKLYLGQGSIFLIISPFWWLMTTRPKQTNDKNLEIKNYLLAGMQYKGQGYMILIYRYQLKLYLKACLALANVPMWYYGLKPSFLKKILPLLRLIHNSNSPPLASNTEKEDISSIREGQISWSIVYRMKWITKFDSHII